MTGQGAQTGIFRRVLVANRGEIAVRIIRACHRMGIATVAVYSDADATALHTTMADTAVRIGPAPAAESYLDGERIIAVAHENGCEAIHPGYGFLSENPDFVEAVTAAGLTFIGPSASAIRAMGLKDAAKSLMAEAGVPIVPGYHGADQGLHRLAAEADAVGYPVLVKAVAGGGGKGMRRVERPADLAAALDSARREASAAFGNDAVLIEKYVETPRHIEIQVFGDSQGNVVHLFERDCSLQRRHQKVIEESPAPGMTPGMRAAMGAAAIKAAAAIGYSGAGTVEFIADASRGLREDGFWFMEMNTRLQVEHPVTEAVTGVDLVEWQLRIAAGESLPLSQQQISITGHAFEARLYAEDPVRGFLPATGRLSHLSFPADVRIDTGVRAGDTISPWYDPMIAKIIAHGPTRPAALARLARALEETRVAGTNTNCAFLGRLVRQPDFARGNVDTGLIDRHLEALTAPMPLPRGALAVAALAATGLLEASDAHLGFTVWAPLVQTVPIEAAGVRHAVAIAVHGPGRFTADGHALEVAAFTGGTLRFTIDGHPQRLGVIRSGREITLFAEGEAWTLHHPDPLHAVAAPVAGGNDIRAPMSGIVKRLVAKPGRAVHAGEVLAILEAMKMEHALSSPRDGVVAEIHVADGAQVAQGSILLVLEAEDD